MSCPWPITIAVDWNGTIVDDRERAWLSTNEALTSRGHSDLVIPDLDRFMTVFGLPLTTFFAQLGVPSVDASPCSEAWNEAMLARPTQLATGARELLEAANQSRVPVVVVSGAHESVVLRDAAKLSVLHRITRVHGAVHPKREVLRRYASLGALTYIGDTGYDINEGLAAGAHTIAVGKGYGKSSELEHAHGLVYDLAMIARSRGWSPETPTKPT
ncbi:MAG: HAD family hydrolase [Microcella sp.]